jgi:hypothetical protein
MRLIPTITAGEEGLHLRRLQEMSRIHPGTSLERHALSVLRLWPPLAYTGRRGRGRGLRRRGLLYTVWRV